MAPAATIDNESDFAPHPAKSAIPSQRILLLAPPSISAHPEALNSIFESHDRSATDIQMLDRLALGLVQLPAATYDVVLLLTDADGTRTESQKLFERDVITKVVQALRPGGRLRSQDGQFGSTDGVEKTEAILAGFVSEGADGMVKPAFTQSQSVPLRLGKKAKPFNFTPTFTNGTTVAAPVTGDKRKSDQAPNGIGFVDFSDDFGDPIITGEDDELIDEDTLLTEEDLARPIVVRST